MSSTPRTATRGGTKKPETNKGHKSDSKKDGTKNSDANKAHPASERIAKITETVTDEHKIKHRIAMVMDVMDGKASEDAVITALHDCDNDVEKAVSLLIEGGDQGQWETSGKKKKSKQVPVTKSDGGTNRAVADGDIEDLDTQPLSSNQDRERSRGRGGGAPRGRGRGSAGRGRDNKENEGLAAGGNDGFRGMRGDRGDGYRRGGRGMSNGPGGRAGRGGRGGRLGSRMYGGRDGDRRDRDSHRFPSTIDTWNPSGTQEKTEPLKMETWDDHFPAPEDWDNEEYTGSLADTKVFTPSAVENSTDSTTEVIAPGAQVTDFHQAGGIPTAPLPVGVGALSTAQAQYLTQLTQQSAENVKANAAAVAVAAYGQADSLKTAVVGIGAGAGSYSQSATYGQTPSYGQSSYAPSSYGASSTYQNSAAYAASSVAGTNTFSSSPSAQAASYSTAQSVPSNAYAASSSVSAGAFSSGSTPYQASIPNYPTGTNSTFAFSTGAGYSSQSYTAPVAYDSSNTDPSASSVQPQRSKTQRPRVPPPSKIPSTAVEMPEDPGVSVTSLDVQFGGLEFGSDGTTLDGVSGVDSNSVVLDSNTSGGLDATSTSQSSLTSYSNKSSTNNQQASLVGGLAGKALTSTDGLGLQSNEHKTSYSTQSARATSSSSGLDLAKSDVTNLSYASAPSAAANYSAYQNQKNPAYQPASYSTGSYTATATTYSSVPPSSYSTVSYANQQSGNSFTGTYGSQPSSTNNYPATYPSTNSFPNSSQNYQSSSASVYANYATGYQNNYSSASVTGKLNSGLTAAKETDVTSSSSSNLVSSTTNGNSSVTTTSTTASGSSLLTSGSATATTTSSKISTGAMKSSVVTNLHPPMIGTPQYIMSGAGVPFYHQAPVYGYEDVQLHQLQRIPHMATQYYDMGYTAPTSLAAGRETMPNVAFTMADARYSARADNAASPVPSTLSQQTATGTHQQAMMNHPSFPPGYTYVYNTVPGQFQYASPIFPVPSAGNAHAHATSTNQFAKPGSYGSSYGSGYEAINQSDYNKSPYVSSAVKSAVGPSVTSSSTSSDLYGKTHTALGKVNSYDKQGFHSATPPPFNLAAGQGTGMAASGAYAGPQLFIPAMPPHQQHHNLIPSHLQDTSSSSGQRTQTTSQAGKSVSKQAYPPYWSAN